MCVVLCCVLLCVQASCADVELVGLTLHCAKTHAHVYGMLGQVDRVSGIKLFPSSLPAMPPPCELNLGGALVESILAAACCGLDGWFELARPGVRVTLSQCCCVHHLVALDVYCCRTGKVGAT